MWFVRVEMATRSSWGKTTGKSRVWNSFFFFLYNRFEEVKFIQFTKRALSKLKCFPTSGPNPHAFIIIWGIFLSLVVLVILVLYLYRRLLGERNRALFCYSRQEGCKTDFIVIPCAAGFLAWCFVVVCSGQKW